jgi:hypothetical protein
VGNSDPPGLLVRIPYGKSGGVVRGIVTKMLEWDWCVEDLAKKLYEDVSAFVL